MAGKRMPVGMDSFENIRRDDCYYVDKTGMIKELLLSYGKVNLFTRPRRFGKSLNLSMLKSFFEIGTDRELFDGLSVVRETDLCEKYMGRFPVIYVTLKEVSGENFDEAEQNLWEEISREADRFGFLADSLKLSARDRIKYQQLCEETGNVSASLRQLSDMLFRHYGERVIILIDEYDAPLQKAYENHYYDDMVKLIRRLFGYALKSNESLFFSVLTGCMRVSKESIFSDLNNPSLYTLVDNVCDEWFGFTDQEVKSLLHDYSLDAYYEKTKDWYDGYRIGRTDIYCPWDVICWCRQLLLDNGSEPQNYWTNVSENQIIYQFAEMADDATKHDLEVLSENQYVDKNLTLDLTYRDLTGDVEHLWGILFTTGYLTQRGRNADGTWRLAIPNREVRSIFGEQIRRWFLDSLGSKLPVLYQAFLDDKVDEIKIQLDLCMRESISFLDGGNSDIHKESFYHGMLLGMLVSRSGWIVKSNRESGKGRSDIALADRRRRMGILIEVKYAKSEEELEEKSIEACDQIKDMNYTDFFLGFDIHHILEYGISFYNKMCYVRKR